MIFLQILKIIGIVLACIVGFVILLLILVMAVPVRYRLAGEGENTDIRACASVRWLLGLLTVRLDYAQKKAAYYVRVAGIKIMKGDLNAEKIEEGIGHLMEDDSRKESTPVEFEKSDYTGRKGFEKKQKLAEKEAAKAEKEAQKAEKEAIRSEKQKEKEQEKKNDERTFFEKISDLCEKIHNFWDKYQTAKYILTAPVTERAWQCIKQQLSGILRHILPRSLRGNVTFGFEDPATTAEVYGVSSSIFAMIDRRFEIIPEMEEKKFAIDAVIKGRIFIGFMVISILKILTNRDIRRVYKYTRKNLFANQN